MQLLEGRSLADELGDLARLPADEALSSRPALLRSFRHVLDAIAYAHDRGVLHRDLKPQNVLIGRFGEVLVADWGLARVRGEADPVAGSLEIDRRSTDSVSTLDGSILGTPAYMPPEQATGRVDRIDERSDVYSLGAILYEILALRPPFEERSTWGVLERVARGELIWPAARAPELAVPRELEAIVRRAMALRRSDRYPDVAAMREDLDAWLEGRLLSAARYSPWDRAAKWVRRNRTASLVAAGVLAVSAGWAGVLGWRTRRDGVARAEAVAAEARALDSEATRRRSDLGPGEAGRFRTEGGERDEEAIGRWYADAARAAEPLDRLSDLAGPGGFDPGEVDARRIDLALDVARRAAALGDDAVARAWLARAVAAGLAGAARAAAEREVEAIRGARVEESLREARGLLERSRRIETGEPEFFDFALNRLVRLGSPDVVRLLLERAAGERRYLYLESADEWERRLSILALGRIGDPRTSGAGGDDAASALTGLLEATPDPERALDLVEALGSLRDARATDVLVRRRLAAAPNSRLAKRCQVALEQLPRAGASAGTDPLEQARTFISLGRVDEALAVYSVAIDRGATAALLVGRARLLADRGDHAGAIADLDRAIELDPGSAGAWLERGYAKLEALDPEGSLADHDEAVRLAPDDPAVLAGRARTRMVLRREAEAIADLDRAIALSPDLADLHNQRGIAHDRIRDRPAARRDLDAALAIEPENAVFLTNRGHVRRELGDLDGALEDLTRSIALDPSHAATFLERAETHLDRGRPEEARLDLDRAASIQGRTSEVLRLAARGLLLDKKPAEALAAVDEAIGLGPPDGPLQLQRALALQALGRVPEAMDAYEDAIRVDPRLPEIYSERSWFWMAAKRWELAAADLTRVLELDPEFPGALYWLAMARYQSNDLVAAGDLLDRRLRGAPCDREALLLLVAVHSAAGRSAEALEAATRLVDLDPADPPARQVRASFLQDVRRWEEAAVDWGVAARAGGDAGARALGHRAQCHEALGRIDEALRDVAEALALAPGDSALLSQRARLLFARGEGRAALADLDRALASRPDDPVLLGARGYLRAQRQEWKAALEDLDRALAADPEDAASLLHRAHARGSLGDLSGALVDVDQALRLLPGQVEAHVERGNLLDGLDRPGEALAAYDRAIELAPDDPTARYNRGLNHLEAGRAAEAALDFQRYVDVTPDAWRGWLQLGRALQAAGRAEEARGAILAARDRAPAELRPEIEGYLGK